ncbi:MAG: DNA gyrase inhibitor YacG [Magnetovibrio sp.]|nr:DNA gyrase inhibitor YacG [Magnetovibrio sp.]
MSGPRKTAKVVPLKGRKCPICGMPAAQSYRPFCSKRCADVDLGRWLNEDYRIPAEEAAELDDEAFPDD